MRRFLDGGRAWIYAGVALAVVPAQAAGFRYAEDQGPGTLNPIFGATMAEARAGELLFESLYADNAELSTVPQLAATAELSPDRQQMTIALRTGVTWHDGTEFTADDVVFTIQAMQDKGTASTEAGRVAFIQSAVALDAHRVRLNFVRPELRPEEKLYFKIVPRARFAGLPVKRADAFRAAPVGTGPWKLHKFNEDSSITFLPNSGSRRAPKLGEVTMREVSDKNYQAKLLLYESLEALVRVLPRDLALLQNSRKVELYPYQTNSWWYLGFNLARAPFDRPEVRRAIASMIDVPALLAPVGTGQVLSGPFVPSSPYYNHDVQPFAYDPDAAESALIAAGMTQDGDSWSYASRPVVLRVAAHKALESAQEVAISLQAQLQERGLRAEMEFLDDAAWKQRVWRDRDFDVVLSQWTFDRNEDVREQFYSTGSRNFVGYRSAVADQFLDQAREAADPFARKAAMRSLHATVHEDAPMVFLWTLDSYAAMATKVGGVVVHPFYFFTFAPGWQVR
jgi:peptide/nickel transport system substrate-binding protein